MATCVKQHSRGEPDWYVVAQTVVLGPYCDGSPNPRHHLHVWGLEALQPAEQLDVDNDSLLVLRLLFLISLMKRYTQEPIASSVEHPQDAMECSDSPSTHRCSSLWATKVFKAWKPTVGHHLVKFDQCRLGQLVAKATTISSDLDICCWDGLKCNHPGHVDMKSSDLSRYSPPMMIGLAGAISKKLRDIGKSSSKPTISWETRAPTNPRVVHGEPLGTKIQQLTDPISQAVRMSISCGEKHHPFSDVLLHQIRELMGATPEDMAPPGQPFFLTLISRLAREAGDPDWEFPLTLQEGVRLGVDEPIP